MMASSKRPAKRKETTSETQRWVRLRRLLDAPPARVYRAWTDPDALARWFPHRVEGSLAVGARSLLIWPEDQRWIEILEAEPERRVRFRWPWLPDDSWTTEVTIDLRARGYGTELALQDGPFDVSRRELLDAYAECLESWAEALTMLRAELDFAVDVRRR
jgi:uncharacterized protein YndB with AHSA1/START domain